MRQGPAPFDMLRRPGCALDWEGEAGRPKPPRWWGHSAAMAWDCRSSASDPASSSPARKAGSASVSVSPSPVACVPDSASASGAARAASPSAQQPLGLLGHLGLLQMVDELRRLLALGFAHRLEDASLGHPAEIVVDGRTPAGRRHVEIDGPRQLSPCANAPGRRFQGSLTTLTASEAQCANSAAWLSLSNAVSASQRSAGVSGNCLAHWRAASRSPWPRRCPPSPAPGR